MGNSFILRFLNEHKDENIYQKDIEKFFGLKKSTITSILNSLEDAGYIERKVGKDDGRLRRIVLTEKGFAMNEKVHNEFETLEENMSNLFSEDEYNNLIASLEKIRNYLEGKDEEDADCHAEGIQAGNRCMGQRPSGHLPEDTGCCKSEV